VRVAVYAGSFDPITLGHCSVIERSERLFDRLLAVVAVNPQKQPLFSAEERLSMLRDAARSFENVEALATEGYVVELARRHGARYLVRGVRGATDVEQEIQLANLNRCLAPEIETVFIPAHPDQSEVSSSKLKELMLRGDDVSPYCSPYVERMLAERLASRGANTHV
jgi:pantetheine-phosphate adenylyltransferase